MGIRNNSGHWKIPDENIRSWIGDVPHTAHAHPLTDHSVKIARLEAENRMLHDSLSKEEAKVRRLEDMLGERWWHPIRDWMRTRQN